VINININPIIFTLGGLEVRWYGIFIMLAIVTVVAWALWQIRKGAKLSNDTIFTAAMIAIPSGIVFSRLLHVIDNIVVARFHPELAASGVVIDYSLHPSMIIGAAGLSAWGAILGAALGLWIYGRVAHFKFGYFADLLAPGIILAQAVGRIGCTINGCCYGNATTLPFGIVYTQPASFGPAGIATQPVTVYEIFFNLIAFGVLYSLRGKFRPDGALFVIYLSLYSAWRLGSDFLREGTPFIGPLHQAQVMSLVILAVSIPWLLIKARPGKATDELPEIPVISNN
jgi:phosphatidylglycerol---prolipoprotein diacylglyceryl transferase